MFFTELALVGGAVGALWYTVQRIGKRRDKARKQALRDQRVIHIVDEKHSGILNKLERLETSTSISLETFLDIKDAIAALEPGKVSLVMHTCGGSLSAAEAICRQLLKAREAGYHFTCYVPYYAYSAGCMIATSCDEIVISETAFLGPADAQQGGLTSSTPIKAICETVEWQIEKCPERVKADWYAKWVEAKATKERQRKWIDELIERKFYSKEAGDRIYEELFSGKYNHDQVIHPAWLAEIGLKVDIVTQMPKFVDDALELCNAKSQ
jgi:membrane-bound ClpP family serine protease